jgi:hypothetical protein
MFAPLDRWAADVSAYSSTPSCDTAQFQAAVDGTGRYTVGWGLRGDPSLPPPVDQLCIKDPLGHPKRVRRRVLGPWAARRRPSTRSTSLSGCGTFGVRYHVPSGRDARAACGRLGAQAPMPQISTTLGRSPGASS